MARPRKTDKHLPPCVYFKNGAYWLVKKNKWTRLGDDLTDALAEYAKGYETRQGGMPDLVDRVMEHLEPKLAKNTMSQYRIAAKRIKEAMGDFAPNQVLPKHVAALKMDMSDTPNMANRVLSVLRTVFAYAVEWQEVDSNPCIGIKRHDEAKRGRYITDDEYARLKACANPRLQVIMDILYLTGQRIGDVLAIKRSDLGPDGISFVQEKTGAKLLVKWTPELRAAVERANTLTGNVVGMYLFRSRARGGKPPGYMVIRDHWQEAYKAAGIDDVHIHDLRAKSLTDAKRQGKDAQMLAGHTSEAMTDRYIRLREVPMVDGPTFAREPKKSA
jgi:integrase